MRSIWVVDEAKHDNRRHGAWSAIKALGIQAGLLFRDGRSVALPPQKTRFANIGGAQVQHDLRSTFSPVLAAVFQRAPSRSTNAPPGAGPRTSTPPGRSPVRFPRPGITGASASAKTRSGVGARTPSEPFKPRRPGDQTVFRYHNSPQRHDPGSYRPSGIA